jgi:hypothetical protein
VRTQHQPGQGAERDDQEEAEDDLDEDAHSAAGVPDPAGVIKRLHGEISDGTSAPRLIMAGRGQSALIRIKVAGFAAA